MMKKIENIPERSSIKYFYEIIPRRGIVLVLAAFFVISLGYSIITPTYEGPDEKVHMDGIKHFYFNGILADWNLPETTPLYFIISSEYLHLLSHGDTLGMNEPIQGPNMYSVFLHGPNDDKFPFFDFQQIIHKLRLFSIVLGLVTVFFTYKISQKIFKENRWYSLVPPSFLVLIPNFIWLSSVINDNNLLIMLSTISVFLLIRVIENTKKEELAILGFILGLDVLAKMNALVLFPAILCIFALELRKKRWNTKEFVKNSLIVFLIALTISLRSLLLMFFDVKTVASPQYIDISAIHTILRPVLFDHFWSGLGHELYLDVPGLLTIYLLITAIILFQIGKFFIKKEYRQFSEVETITFRVILFAITFSLIGFGYVLLHGIGQPRNIYEVLPAIAVLFAIGILFSGKNHKQSKMILLSVFLLMSIGSLFSFVGYADRMHESIITIDSINDNPTALSWDSIESKILSYFSINPNFQGPLILSKSTSLETNLKNLFPEAEQSNYSRLKEWTYNNLKRINTLDISELPQHQYGSIDHINNQILSENNEIILNKPAYVGLVGWALSDNKGPVDLVYVFLDGKPAVLAEYGKVRPDVYDYFNNNAFPYPGWRAIFSTKNISDGCHKIDVIVLSNNTFSRLSTLTPLCIAN